MNKETKHLLYWQWEWFKRFLTTWFHIFYRPAYKKYLEEKRMKELDDYKSEDNYFGEEFDV